MGDPANQLRILAELVRSMREAQKAFFRNRDPGRNLELLGVAKELECQVDWRVKEVLSPPGLFDREDPE